MRRLPLYILVLWLVLTAGFLGFNGDTIQQVQLVEFFFIEFEWRALLWLPILPWGVVLVLLLLGRWTQYRREREHQRALAEATQQRQRTTIEDLERAVGSAVGRLDAAASEASASSSSAAGSPLDPSGGGAPSALVVQAKEA